MQVILFITYLILFTWLITRIRFFKNSFLNKRWLLALFLIKIAAGIAYGVFYAQPQYINTSDTWGFYRASLVETDWLLRDPVGFIKDLFHYSYTTSGSLFTNEASYWNDLKSNSMIKLVAVVNVFTAKSYYTNIIFFNFLYLFGPVALYKLTVIHYPINKLLLMVPVFLLPSFLFWCSGIHKDGLIFSAMLLAIYSVYLQLKKRKLLLLPCLLITACCIVLFALRNFVVLLLIPALFAWIVSEKYPSKKWLVYSSIYAAGLVLFFTARYIHPAMDFPQYVVAKQAEFNALSGNSKIDLPLLRPTAEGFAAFLPFAADMAFLQPHWNAVKSLAYLPAILENTVILLMLLAGAVAVIRGGKINPFTLFLLCLSCSLLILSGYTVTFAGAIVRYKSIATPLLAVAACSTFLQAFNKHLSNILSK